MDANIERKKRNLICRRIRLSRKINIQEFNYFVTFTYNNALHTEDSFKKGLKKTLANFASRRSWKYVGVWERSPKKQRLHFHGLFNIPEGTIPPLMIEVNDYNFNTHRRQITHQNTYFNDRFGRTDFETIKDKSTLGSAVAYIMKYLEKTGEKIVYSKGLPQYFISDIMDEDILCPYYAEDEKHYCDKYILFDTFRCWDEGLYMGDVSPETIAKMRKSNGKARAPRYGRIAARFSGDRPFGAFFSASFRSFSGRAHIGGEAATCIYMGTHHNQVMR